jgi:hypothetical protein
MELPDLERIADAATDRFRLETLPAYFVPREVDEVGSPGGAEPLPCGLGGGPPAGIHAHTGGRTLIAPAATPTPTFADASAAKDWLDAERVNLVVARLHWQDTSTSTTTSITP